MRDDNAPLSRYGIQDGSTILLLGSVSLTTIQNIRL